MVTELDYLADHVGALTREDALAWAMVLARWYGAMAKNGGILAGDSTLTSLSILQDARDADVMHDYEWTRSRAIWATSPVRREVVRWARALGARLW
jgi:hypothetical protein